MVSREGQDKVLLAFQFPDFCSLDLEKKKETKTKAHSLIVSLITLPRNGIFSGNLSDTSVSETAS